MKMFKVSPAEQIKLEGAPAVCANTEGMVPSGISRQRKTNSLRSPLYVESKQKAEFIDSPGVYQGLGGGETRGDASKGAHGRPDDKMGKFRGSSTQHVIVVSNPLSHP